MSNLLEKLEYALLKIVSPLAVKFCKTQEEYFEIFDQFANRATRISIYGFDEVNFSRPEFVSKIGECYVRAIFEKGTEFNANIDIMYVNDQIRQGFVLFEQMQNVLALAKWDLDSLTYHPIEREQGVIYRRCIGYPENVSYKMFEEKIPSESLELSLSQC